MVDETSIDNAYYRFALYIDHQLPEGYRYDTGVIEKTRTMRSKRR
jgi:hypothetical protein